MFTQSQLIFGIVFAVVFVAILVVLYRKDLKMHKYYYKGSLWVLLAFLGFIGGIVAIKFLLG